MPTMTLIQGVYVITNGLNQKQYVGSTNDIYQRWGNHWSQLKRGIHYSKLLQEEWNIYGLIVFDFYAVELVPNPKNLFDKEQEWVDRLLPEYNQKLEVGKREARPWDSFTEKDQLEQGITLDQINQYMRRRIEYQRQKIQERLAS